MEILDIPLDKKLSEKLTLLVPYLYTDTLKLLLILELLNISLIIYNFFVLFGLKISTKTRTILGNIFTLELITKILHLTSIYLICDRNTITLKHAIIFAILFSANFAFYFLNKLICYAVLTNDKIMNSESLKNWKVLLWIYLTIISSVGLGALTIVYEPSLLTTYAAVLILVVTILILYIFISLVKREYRNLRKCNEVSEGDKVRLILLRIMIYIPFLVFNLCFVMIRKQNILDVCPVVMFLYFIYLRRISNRKLREEIKKNDGEIKDVKKSVKEKKIKDVKNISNKSNKDKKKVINKKND